MTIALALPPTMGAAGFRAGWKLEVQRMADPSGSYLIFTSNWLQTLAPDPDKSCGSDPVCPRHDVFLVELR